ncbi:hypothetical protein QYM36_008343 [Artemia franciscana]|uniref:Uncharacterized protein n=3 Tax=Artemia franciscana TaxID=6661 RepID=A0AA88IEN7_ARTSF|nr:hypothetical protein QYM36_008343 [Artemia franciscana]
MFTIFGFGWVQPKYFPGKFEMTSYKPRFGRVNRSKFRHLDIDLSSELVFLEGMALLCFQPDCSSFRGNLQGKDGSSYELTGKCLYTERCSFSESSDDSMPSSRRDSISDEMFIIEEDSIVVERPERSLTPRRLSERPKVSVFDIIVSDMEQGLQFVVPDVKFVCGQECNISSKDISFHTDVVYWGQKADLVILKHFGPDFVEKGCMVYAGDLKIKYKDSIERYAVTPEASSSWCM